MKKLWIVILGILLLYGCGVPTKETSSSSSTRSAAPITTGGEKFALIFAKTDADYLVVTDINGNAKSTIWYGKSNWPSEPTVYNSQLYFYVSPNRLYVSDYSGNKSLLSSTFPESIPGISCLTKIAFNGSGNSYIYDTLTNTTYTTNYDIYANCDSGTKFIGDEIGKITKSNLDGTSKTTLLNESPTTSNYEPSISPDDLLVAYVKTNLGKTYIAVNNTFINSESIILDGDANGIVTIERIVWLSNTQLAFEGENSSGYIDIFSINSNGTGLTNLTNTSSSSERFSWKTVSQTDGLIYYNTGNSIMSVDFNGVSKTTCFTSLDNIGSFVVIQ